jgi:hypothetical protein
MGERSMTDHPITYETIFIDLLGYKEVPSIVLQDPAIREDYIVGKFSASFVLEIAQLAYDKGKQDGGNEDD